MAKKKIQDQHLSGVTSALAKSDDGTVQITFSIPQTELNAHEDHALAELAQSVDVPGFRPGKAPMAKVRERVSKEKLVEKTLMHILPEAFANAIQEYKLRPVTYPKFEVLSQAEIWEIRATTAEIIDFDLGDYKKIVHDALNTPKLWTPGQDQKPQEPSAEEKEQKALQTLLESIKITVPRVLIEDEVSHRLSQLLARIEKLGLNLESYLSSLGKTHDQLRQEYEEQTKASIALELILNKIAELEKIVVSPKQIDEAMQAASGDPAMAKQAKNPEQRRIIESILRRRAVLDALITD